MGLFKHKESLIDSGLLSGAADRHSHILYGVDDGVRELKESLEILSFLETQGLGDLWLTPHVMEDVPNTTERLQKRFGQLCELYSGPVRLHLAAEYMMDALLLERLASHDLLTMEDKILLVETSTWRAPENWKYLFEKMQAEGYRPLFAHVERYQYMTDEDYDELHEKGVLMQLNYGSLTGFYGESAMRKAHELLAKGYYTFCGSDCHRFSNLQQQYSAKSLKPGELNALKGILH